MFVIPCCLSSFLISVSSVYLIDKKSIYNAKIVFQHSFPHGLLAKENYNIANAYKLFGYNLICISFIQNVL